VAVVVAVVDTLSVVDVVVETHSPHPMQQSHEHLNAQLSMLSAQNDLHSLSLGVKVLVVTVVVAGEGVVVVGAEVGDTVTGCPEPLEGHVPEACPTQASFNQSPKPASGHCGPLKSNE
jgi:hypothetical protein